MKAIDGRWALGNDTVAGAQALAQRGERLRVVVFLSVDAGVCAGAGAGAATAVAAVETEEEEEARTADVVAHDARGHGAHGAGELLPSDDAAARWPATR
jgi:hypothetical protein